MGDLQVSPIPLFPPISTHLHIGRALYTQPSRVPVPVGRHPGHCLLVTAPSAHHTTLPVYDSPCEFSYSPSNVPFLCLLQSPQLVFRPVDGSRCWVLVSWTFALLWAGSPSDSGHYPPSLRERGSISLEDKAARGATYFQKCGCYQLVTMGGGGGYRSGQQSGNPPFYPQEY